VVPFSDLVIIVGVALLCAVVVGGVGLLVLRAARRAPMLVQVLVVVIAAIVSVIAGVVATAQAMYVSPHDFAVVMTVITVSTLISIAVAVVLGRTFTRRSNRIRMLAQALGDGQRLVVDSDDTDTSEFAALASDLAATSERLAQAREEVAAIDASRRELIAWISHDLRTPLAGLRAMAEALEDGLADDPTRFHRQMRSQVDHLSAMVDDLFELSKINSGNLALTMEPLSLFDLASDAVAEVSHLARSRDITLTAPEHGDYIVIGDPRELARVVGNLLMNAIQHSPSGSMIAVSTAYAGDGHVVLTVEDSGGGIPEKDLSKVFQAGWRATESRTPEQLWGQSAGAGLGLAIVQGIVEAHSGDISVRNVPGGCRFDVRLPRHEIVAA
jgi:signal transduction histidine kinase